MTANVLEYLRRDRTQQFLAGALMGLGAFQFVTGVINDNLFYGAFGAFNILIGLYWFRMVRSKSVFGSE